MGGPPDVGDPRGKPAALPASVHWLACALAACRLWAHSAQGRSPHTRLTQPSTRLKQKLAARSSIRTPAAFQSLAGMRATTGLISR